MRGLTTVAIVTQLFGPRCEQTRLTLRVHSLVRDAARQLGPQASPVTISGAKNRHLQDASVDRGLSRGQPHVHNTFMKYGNLTLGAASPRSPGS